ncbi:MAG: glycosyltransferase, partial [Muribaculaceae bacterium]|nr:glycosyltransferase [Muribaculaceae bacterium]
MEIKASIIILTYNQAATIGRAIESVLRQRPPYPYEIIIADDNSTDRTREIAESYAAQHPSIIRILPPHQNLGLVGNYFHALSQCRGEYIGDCAGDDEWLDETRMARQIEILDSDPGISVVFTDVEEYRIDSDGNLTSDLHSSNPQRKRWMRPLIPGREILLATLNHTTSLPLTLSAALYRKSIIERQLRISPHTVKMEEMLSI